MMKTTLFALAGLLIPFAAAQAEVVETAVDYKDGDQVFEGFHAYDSAVKGKRPAILVVHQWTGLTDYEKRRSRMLAELGYNVFALDIYGKGVRPAAPVESGKMAGKYKGDRELFRARLKLGLDVLLKDERTDASKVVAIGYCFGGTGALEVARMGAPVQGVVSFHGGLAPAEGFEAKDGSKLPKVLVLHGAADPYSPAADVEGFRKEAEAAKADYQIVLYGPNVVHSFTQPHAGDDPSKGAAYDKQADERSWEAMKGFLGRCAPRS
jgi:dienelactone hydrolase